MLAVFDAHLGELELLLDEVELYVPDAHLCLKLLGQHRCCFLRKAVLHLRAVHDKSGHCQHHQQEAEDGSCHFQGDAQWSFHDDLSE